MRRPEKTPSKFIDMLTSRGDVTVDARARETTESTIAPDAAPARATPASAPSRVERTCDRCGTATTSRWRRLDGGSVCKACFQRHVRAMNAIERRADGGRCVQCGSETSRGDWVRAKSKDGWLCGSCYDGEKRRRRRESGIERACPRCEETTTMWLLRDPGGARGADGEDARVCAKCYQRAKYRERKARDDRRCDVCGEGRAMGKEGTRARAWRRLPRENGEEAAGKTKWACEACFRRAEAAAVNAGENGEETTIETPKYAMKFCAFCETEKESSRWRKMDEKDACSSCYQATWRRRKRESGR